MKTTYKGVKTAGFRLGVSNDTSNVGVASEPLSLSNYFSGVRTTDASTQNGSSNNKTTSRANEARPNKRIPDIFGKVFSVPDLISLNYSCYINNVETEIGYFCVGRGDHTITAVKEDGTEFNFLTDAKYDVYGSGSSPISNTGTIGTTFVGVVNSIGENSNILSKALPVRAPNGSDTENPLTVGPFVFDNIKGAVVNINAGYLLSEGSPLSRNVTYYVTFQNVDTDNVPYGPTDTKTYTVNAYNVCLGVTQYAISTTLSGRMQVTITRANAGSTPEVPSSGVYKQIYVSGIYGILDIGVSDFGNVTTIRAAVSRSTDHAIPAGSTEDPADHPTGKANGFNLSCHAHRKIDGTATSKFSDIAEAVCLDSKIGNLASGNVDSSGLASLQTAIDSYFGTGIASEFNYTFDDEETSFEETLFSVCNAAFVIPYRDGKVIKFKFEQPQTANKLLFNHRNKVPGTETRKVTFGYNDDKDGVRIEYTDIADGAKLYVYQPNDQSANNLQTSSPVGITNRLQAYFHAMRQFNKQKYQNTIVEFEATQEAMLLNVKDMIIVADNTRTETYDGEVVAKNGLILTLSQPFTFPNSGTVTIFVQNITGDVEAIGITEIAGEPYQVLLDSEPIEDLSIGRDKFAKAVYEIAIAGRPRRGSFLVEEKTQTSVMTVGLVVVNYDNNYYANDQDYNDGIVDINGEEI